MILHALLSWDDIIISWLDFSLEKGDLFLKMTSKILAYITVCQDHMLLIG